MQTNFPDDVLKAAYDAALSYRHGQACDPIHHDAALQEVIAEAIMADRAASLSIAEPVATVAEMGVGGMRVLMPHPPGSADHLPIGAKLYAAHPASYVAVNAAIDDLPDEEVRHICHSKDVAQFRGRLKSALSAQVQDMAGWQPIETAPKDGSTILGAYADKVLTVRWEPDGYENRGGKSAWIDGSFDLSEEYFTHPVTHWMPLPSAPTPAKQEGGE